MKSLEESVVIAMDGSDPKLFPFLPYILQDLWDIGSDPDGIINLICKHTDTSKNLKVLDLGCGKGIVSVKIAQKLNFKCHGIDAIPEFIADARQKAKDFKVDDLCKFETGDIRESVKTLPEYDIIILGSIGPVFGNYYATLTAISKCLDKDGMIMIDDGYIDNNSDFSHPLIQKKEAILQQIKASGMQLIDEEIIDREGIETSNEFIFEKLQKRCLELIHKYPDKQQLFRDYIQKQKEENEVLENKIHCSTLVIKRGIDIIH